MTRTIVLARGSHPAPAGGAPAEGCFFEWYNWIVRREYTDRRPPGVSAVLWAFGQRLNDILPGSRRQRLTRFLPDGSDRLAGTADDGRDEARGFMCLDWLVRTDTPVWFDLAGLDGEAAALRGLPRIGSLRAARLAGPVVRAAAARSAAARARAKAEARDVTWDVTWDAALDAAWAESCDSPREAAWGAVWDTWDAALDAGCSLPLPLPLRWAAAELTAAGAAARDAVIAAAWSAARDAAARDATARDAGGDAAGKKIAPAVAALQDSAISLFDALITGEWAAS